MQKPSASVIVPTRNRPEKIKDCCKYLLVNNFKYFELIIVDQSSNNKTKNIIQQIIKRDSFKKIKYFKMEDKGASKARNLGIKKSKGEIIIFTDDDCIVGKNFVKDIYLSFKKNKQISAMLVKVLPYKPKEHKKLICVSVNNLEVLKIMSKPKRYDHFIFSLNALSFKKEVFIKLGVFKEWLDPGSLAYGTADDDLAYRMLTKGMKILLNPKITIYHDNWLAKKDADRLMLQYSCGFFACFLYHSFMGDKQAQEYIYVFVINKIKEWIGIIKKSYPYPRRIFSFILNKFIIESYYYFRGCLLGLFHFIKDSISKNFSYANN